MAQSDSGGSKSGSTSTSSSYPYGAPPSQQGQQNRPPPQGGYPEPPPGGYPPPQGGHPPPQGGPSGYPPPPSGYPPDGQRRQRELTPEEKAVLDECSRESFFYRSLPLSILASFGVSAAYQQGWVKKQRPFLHYGAAITLAYIIGKLSYVQPCLEKIKKLKNSPLADEFRRMEKQSKRGQLFPDTPTGQSYPGPPSYSPEKDPYQGAGGSQQRDPNAMTYDELRRRNREEAWRKQQQPPPPPQDYSGPPPKQTSDQSRKRDAQSTPPTQPGGGQSDLGSSDLNPSPLSEKGDEQRSRDKSGGGTKYKDTGFN